MAVYQAASSNFSLSILLSSFGDFDHNWARIIWHLLGILLEIARSELFRNVRLYTDALLKF